MLGVNDKSQVIKVIYETDSQTYDLQMKVIYLKFAVFYQTL